MTAPQARRALRLGIAAICIVLIAVIGTSAVVQMATRGP